MKTSLSVAFARTAKNGIVLLILIATALTGPLIAGTIDGAIRPVVDPAKIDRLYETSADYVTIYGSSFRHRDCPWRGLEWVSDKGGAVPFYIEETQKDRDLGPFKFGPWRMNTTRNRLLCHSSAIALHACNPIFLTRSIFWVPDPDQC